MREATSKFMSFARLSGDCLPHDLLSKLRTAQVLAKTASQRHAVISWSWVISATSGCGHPPKARILPEAVRTAQIAGVLPRFNAGREFKKVLDTIEYVKTSEPAPIPVEE